MVDRIAEPASSNPMTADWQTLLNKLTVTTGSFYLMDFSPYDGTNSPKVKAGSRFEINASFFFVATDEEITGFAAIPNNSTAYVYAIPNQPNPGEASTCTFEYKILQPLFSISL